MDGSPQLHPVTQALLAGCFTWAVTALSAALVMFTREVTQGVLDTMEGFASCDDCRKLLVTTSAGIEMSADGRLRGLRCCGAAQEISAASLPLLR